MIPLPRKTKRSNLSLVKNRADKTVPLTAKPVTIEEMRQQAQEMVRR